VISLFDGRKDWAWQHQQTGRSHLRNLFTAGALAVIRYAKVHQRQVGRERIVVGRARGPSQ
jgi:hypothetical protein